MDYQQLWQISHQHKKITFPSERTKLMQILTNKREKAITASQGRIIMTECLICFGEAPDSKG
ncbi:unnamed protein product [Musa hybrid cultivar]